jgi:hypothetical protein
MPVYDDEKTDDKLATKGSSANNVLPNDKSNIRPDFSGSLTKSQLRESEGGSKDSLRKTFKDTSKSLYNNTLDTSVGPGGRAKKFFWGSKRRKQASVGGGLAAGGVTGGVLLLTLFGGTGFQFIHLSQLLEKFHFGSQQNLQDGQFVKMVRYATDIPKGAIERTRMGFVGNQFANYYERQLNASGLTSSYSDRFGLLDGYVIDSSKIPEVDGLEEGSDEWKAAIADKFGVEPQTLGSIEGHGTIPGVDADDVWVLNVAKLKFRETYSLNYNVLREAGLDKMSAAIGARLFCVRADCDWHPLSNVASNLKRKVGEKNKATSPEDEEEEAASEAANDDLTAEATGQDPAVAADNGSNPNNSDPDESTDTSDKKLIDGAVTAENAGAEAANKNVGLLSSFGTSIKGTLLGGVAAIGVLCTLHSFNSQVDQLKETEVILPLIRMAMQAISLGNQIMNGQDVNTYEMNDLSSELYGKDSAGNNTSWIDAASIQSNLGNQGGVAPDSTLKSISSGSPFAFIDSIPGINAVCSTVGQAASGVLGFALDLTGVGGIIDSIVSGIAKGTIQGVAVSQVSSTAAQWLAGKPINVAAQGADYGSDLDFGAQAAASQQAISSAGTALNPSQAAEINGNDQLTYNLEVNSQSLSTKLFSVDDPSSLVSDIFADSQPSITGNIDMLFSHFTNIASSIAHIPDLFIKSVDAASTTNTGSYSYPFSTYGFSEEDIDNPAVANPYINNCYVIGCPADPSAGVSQPINGILTGTPNGGPADSNGASYISRAESCFGVTIAEDSGGYWDVTAPANGPNINPYASNYPSICGEQAPADCTVSAVANSDPCNWLRIRFFILDTETQNSMGCYAGDDESCSDVGFNQAPATTTPQSTTFNSQAAQTVIQQASTSGTKVGYAIYTSSGTPVDSDNDSFENYGASITKSMILVAYLNQIGSGTLSSAAQLNLINMIENSNNDAANWVYGQLTNGPAEISQVATEAGMTGFQLDDTSDPTYILGQSQITAEDFALFFSKINTLINSSQSSFGMNLLANLSSTDQVGLLKSGLPTPVYSKEGWKPETNAYVVNQAAQFSENGTTYGIAVTVDGGASATQTSDEAIVQSLVSALISTGSQ